MDDDRENHIIFDEVGNFMGTGSRSPSHKYMIAIGSRMADGDKFGDHALVLFYREKPIFRAKLADRIHEACVDDDGHFCLQTFEWPKKADGETFLFFRHTGEQYASVFAPRYPHLLGFERDGGRVLFVTDEKVIALNISPTFTIASFTIPRHFRPTDAYTDDDRKLVFLSESGSEYYRFSFSGAFLDEDKWFRNFVSRVDGLTLYYAVRDRYLARKDWTPEHYREAANCIAIALERGIKDSFHLSQSDVFCFLSLLKREAGDEPAATAAQAKAEEVMDGFRVVDLLADRIDQMVQDRNLPLIREQLNRLEKAETYPRLDQYPNYFGRLFKFKGSLYLALGDRDNAATAFRRAIEINPRVGCKRQLKQLIETRT